MTFCIHFAVVTRRSPPGVLGNSDGGGISSIYPPSAASTTPLLVFMVGQPRSVRSFLGHGGRSSRRQALDHRALFGIFCLLRMILKFKSQCLFAAGRPLRWASLLRQTLVFPQPSDLVAGGNRAAGSENAPKRLYTSDLIGVGASVNTTACGGIFRRRHRSPSSGLAHGWREPACRCGRRRGLGRRCRLQPRLLEFCCSCRCRAIAGPALLMRSKLIVRK